MPYFRILIHYGDGSSLKCIRQHNSWDIEFVNRYFAEQIRNNYRGKTISDMEVVMVSKNAKDVKDFIHSKVRKGYSN